MMAQRRLTCVAAHFSANGVDAEKPAVGEFDSHDDNGLRVNEVRR